MTPPPPLARGPLGSPTLESVVLALFAVLRLTWRVAEPLTGDAVRYAAVSLTMVESGDWLHPVHGGEPYFAKPPLVPWLGAVAIRLFGRSVPVVCIPCVLAGVAIVVLVARIARRHGGPLAGMCAGIGLLLTPSFVRLTGTFRMDGPLLLTALGVLWSVERARERPWWFAAGWAFLALGVLVKGTPGLYPLGVLAGGALVLRDPYPFSRGAFWAGAAAFFAVTAPWYVHMTSTYGSAFWGVHLGKEVGDRFALADGGSTWGLLWASLRFPSALLPLAGVGAVLAWRDGRERPALRRATALALVWIVGVWLGQAVNANGFARHMYTTFAAVAGLAGYGVARLAARFAPVVRAEAVTAAVAVACVGWIVLRLLAVPGLGVQAPSKQQAVLDAVEREVRDDPVLVVTRREHEAGDFLWFHLHRPSRRAAPEDLDAILAEPRVGPLFALVDDRGHEAATAHGAVFVASADTFSLARFDRPPPR